MDPFDTRLDPARLWGSTSASALAVRYDVVEEVARGGMGVVFRARHRTLDRQVAIKVVLPGASTDRFCREARLLAKINSPHVVGVHDFDMLPDGSPILVMEWVEGTNLFQLLRARGAALSEKEALPWMRQTAAGLLAAAEQGIIHRDFKPSNILIDVQGKARVSDFGLARGPTNLGESSQTTGGMLGTPYYMAPEQAEDPHGVDTRADIYSYGATFYHALTGRTPFEGETAFTVLYRHKTEPLIPPRARNPHISDRIGELLERCLAKSPNDRFQSLAEVLRHLEPESGTVSPWEDFDDRELAGYLARYQARREIYLTQRRMLDVPDLYEFPRQRCLRIVRGNILDQPVDALVSSDDEKLSMGGGVSAAIAAAAGPRLVAEARRYGRVRPGRAVVTSGGDLAVPYILHGVTLGAVYDQWIRPSRDLILEILASCFYHADSLHVESIALPLLGTGVGGFSEGVCLDTMFRFLARQLLRGLTTVKDVRIVLYPIRKTDGGGGERPLLQREGTAG